MVHFFFMQNFLNAKKLKNNPLVNSLGTKRYFYAYFIQNWPPTPSTIPSVCRTQFWKKKTYYRKCYPKIGSKTWFFDSEYFSICKKFLNAQKMKNIQWINSIVGKLIHFYYWIQNWTSKPSTIPSICRGQFWKQKSFSKILPKNWLKKLIFGWFIFSSCKTFWTLENWKIIN